MTTTKELYQVSVPADLTLAPECFTTLAVRIHKNKEIADEAAAKLLAVLGHEEPNAVLTTNKTGNFSALACAECLPERLGMATFLNDLGLLHDDAVDGMDFQKTNDAHRKLIAVFRLAAKGGDISQLSNPKHLQLAGFLQKFIATDPEAAIQVCIEYEIYLKAVCKPGDISERRDRPRASLAGTKLGSADNVSCLFHCVDLWDDNRGPCV